MTAYIGSAGAADFSTDEWTFDMLEDYRVSAGRHAIMRESDYLAMRSEVEALRTEVARQHAEILRLRLYAPGGRAPHKITMAPHVGPTNFAFYGMADVETDFDSFGHTVPNESEL